MPMDGGKAGTRTQIATFTSLVQLQSMSKLVFALHLLSAELLVSSGVPLEGGTQSQLAR